MQPKTLYTFERFQTVGRLRGGGGWVTARRQLPLVSLQLFSGGDSVVSTSASSAIGCCAVELSLGRGLRQRTIRVACSTRDGSSHGKRRKDLRNLGGQEALRQDWKWHERQTPPKAWSQGSSALDSQSSDHLHSQAPEGWDSRDGADTPPMHHAFNASEQVDADNEQAVKDSCESPEEEFQRFAQHVPKKNQSGINLIQEIDTGCSLASEVYVVLFGLGKTATEGIYSLRSHSQLTGLHTETIICFECHEDAVRFAGLLEATMTHHPSVHTIRPKDLVKFCIDSGYACRLELKGSMMMPPEFNVGITDWERSLRLRAGKYSVLEEEPDVEREALISCADEKESNEGKPNGIGDNLDKTSKHPEMSDSIAIELGDVRKMLERLLPED